MSARTRLRAGTDARPGREGGAGSGPAAYRRLRAVDARSADGDEHPPTTRTTSGPPTRPTIEHRPATRPTIEHGPATRPTVEHGPAARPATGHEAASRPGTGYGPGGQPTVGTRPERPVVVGDGLWPGGGVPAGAGWTVGGEAPWPDLDLPGRSDRRWRVGNRWPRLPDDGPLWSVPEAAGEDVEHRRRLDREQAGD